MDAARFDGLVRHFASSMATRRTGLRLVTAAIAAALGIGAGETDAKKRHGKNNKKNNKKKDDKKKDKPECTVSEDCNRIYRPGLDCVNGQCLCKQGGNCSGCCKSSKVCVQKDTQGAEACGIGGKACEVCNPYVGCDREQGKCICTPDTTCAGCCYTDSAGKAHCSTSGTENKTCGKHITCVDCTKTGRVCQYNGTCCVPVGGACGGNPDCCAAAGVSCQDGVCKNIT